MGNILQFVASGLTTGSIYALIAIGFSVIHNATRIVNIMQCEFITYGGMLTVTFYLFSKLPYWLAIVLSIVCVSVMAGLFERVVLRNSRSKEIIILIFITIGASIFFKGVALLIWGSDPFMLPPFSGNKPLKIFNAVIIPQNLWVIGISILTVILLHFFFYKTITGKAMRAVSCNIKAAKIVGININKVVFLSFVIGGFLGAVAGIIIAPITTTSYDVGFMLGLKGFAAAILGGYGSMAGSIIGGILLGLLESLGAGLISSEYKDVIAFMILILVIYLKPSGILGLAKVERV